MTPKEKIGVGITTCNRPDFFQECIKSIDLEKIDHLVVVNDGDPFDFVPPSEKVLFVQNETNLGVGRSKNKIFQRLLSLKCDHIFTLEDDCIVVDNTVFEKYIHASKTTGLKHFNFGPGSPWNREQSDPTLIGDLSRRQHANQDGKPNPKMTVVYNDDVSIALYEHIVAMFCYFDAKALGEVGLLDERFYNAWEHVEHTFRFIKKNYYTPFWWFADIVGSEKLLKEAKNEKARSSLAKTENQFMKQTVEGLQVFYDIHKTVPSMIYPARAAEIAPILKTIYANNQNH